MFVSEILDDVIEILGRCDREKALKRLTDAVRALQDEGDWNANIGVLDIRTFNDGNTVTLPREVETPLAVTIDGIPVFGRDEFSRFHLNGDGLTDERTVPWVWDDVGIVSTTMNIKVPGPIIARCDLRSDEGLLTRIMGIDEFGNQLRQQTEDGLWLDGIFLPLQFSTLIPTVKPLTRIQKRIFATSVMKYFSSSADHKLITGVRMQAIANTGLFPQPLNNGFYYYIQATDSNTVTIHNTRLDAQLNQSPIQITKLSSTSSISLIDERIVTARTMVKTSGANGLNDLDIVSFGATMYPPEIKQDDVFYVKTLGTENFNIYRQFQDAKFNSDPVNVTDPGSGLQLRKLLNLAPVTTLNFQVFHNLITGDSVTIKNSGGDMPEPLVENTTYFVRKIDDYRITLHNTSSDATGNLNSIVFVSLGSGISVVSKVIPISAITLGNSANVTTSVPHNLSNPSGSGATGTATLTNQTVTSIAIGGGGGTGYNVSPIVRITGGGGTGASAAATVSGGKVVSVNVITGGTGYTTVPTIQFEPASGSFIQFTTTGTLPTPLNADAVYRAEAAIGAPMTGTTFTVNSSIPEAISLTSTGSGSLFLLINRAFSVGFSQDWQLNANSFSTGSAIKIFTTGAVPVTSPQIDTQNFFYIRKLGDTRIQLYRTFLEAIATASTTGIISAISLGIGDLYAFTERSAQIIPRDNQLDVEFSAFLGNLVPATFTTTGTLPQPLVPSFPYLVSVVNDQIEVFTTASVPVSFTGIGSGAHKLRIENNFAVDAATTLDVANQAFSTGTEVTTETEVDLPDPLLPNTTYFVRSASSDTIELYGSKAEAENTASTVGRFVFFSTGSGTQRLVFNVNEENVAEVYNVQHPITDGFKRLYAWDTGRDQNIAFLGNSPYFETNPAYRRIQIRENAKWIRMKYRRRGYDLTTEYDFINLDSKMAILMMVQSQELLLRKFADESERYRAIAVEYLNKRNRAIDGARITPIQVNADIMSNPDDLLI
jgi:hypothetical protein